MPKRKSPDSEPSAWNAKQPKQAKLNLSGNLTTKDEVSTEPNVQHFKVPSKDREITCERRGPSDTTKLIFTHGAGGGLSTAATKDFADGFAEHSPVVSFQGSINLQSRTRGFQALLEHEKVDCALGGRSMGARAAVLAAQQSSDAINELVLVSYPMIGAQKGDSREQILLDLPEGLDVLFISGSNDSMCSITKLREVLKKMKPRTWLIEVQGADHGMSVKPKAGTQPVVKQTGLLAAQWLRDRHEAKPYYSLRWDGAKRAIDTAGWNDYPN